MVEGAQVPASAEVEARGNREADAVPVALAQARTRSGGRQTAAVRRERPTGERTDRQELHREKVGRTLVRQSPQTRLAGLQADRGRADDRRPRGLTVRFLLPCPAGESQAHVPHTAAHSAPATTIEDLNLHAAGPNAARRRSAGERDEGKGRRPAPDFPPPPPLVRGPDRRLRRGARGGRTRPRRHAGTWWR